jgi:hypothetical protein
MSGHALTRGRLSPSPLDGILLYKDRPWSLHAAAQSNRGRLALLRRRRVRRNPVRIKSDCDFSTRVSVYSHALLMRCGRTPPAEVIRHSCPEILFWRWLRKGPTVNSPATKGCNLPVTRRRPIYANRRLMGWAWLCPAPPGPRSCSFLVCTLHLRSLRVPASRGGNASKGLSPLQSPPYNLTAGALGIQVRPVPEMLSRRDARQ